MNAHNIVTNSYSCGIGEQNQNALMMGNMKTEYFMNTEIKKIQASLQIPIKNFVMLSCS